MNGTGLGTLLALIAVAVGAVAGGNPLSILQPVSLLVVGLGTLATALIARPFSQVSSAIAQVFTLYASPRGNRIPDSILAEMLSFCEGARKEGFLAMEPKLAELKHPLFREGARMVVDGRLPEEVKALLRVRIARESESSERAAEVCESAGTHAPAIGILAAVLLLIAVLGKLEEPAALGAGVARAFVAILYGIGLANVFMLPWAERIRLRADAKRAALEQVALIVEALQEGASIPIIRERLSAHASADPGE